MRRAVYASVLTNRVNTRGSAGTGQPSKMSGIQYKQPAYFYTISDDRWLGLDGHSTTIQPSSTAPRILDCDQMLCARGSRASSQMKMLNASRVQTWSRARSNMGWSLSARPEQQLDMIQWPANLQVKVIELLSSPIEARWLHDWPTVAMLDFPPPLKPCPISRGNLNTLTTVQSAEPWAPVLSVWLLALLVSPYQSSRGRLHCFQRLRFCATRVHRDEIASPS